MAHGTARWDHVPLGANLEGDGPLLGSRVSVGLSQKAQSAQEAQCRAASGQARLCKRIKPSLTQSRVAMSPLPSRNGPTWVARCLDRLNARQASGIADEPEFFLVTYHLPGTAGPSKALEEEEKERRECDKISPSTACCASPTITKCIRYFTKPLAWGTDPKK